LRDPFAWLGPFLYVAESREVTRMPRAALRGQARSKRRAECAETYLQPRVRAGKWMLCWPLDVGRIGAGLTALDSGTNAAQTEPR
jgi:hypothetical protein